MSDLSEWYILNKQLKEIKEKEMTLRKKICAEYFPEPVEGTNTYVLDDGAKLKSVHKIQRDVDEAEFAAMKLLTTADCSPLLFVHRLVPPKPECKIADFLKINFDSLVNWKPFLKITEYTKLDDVQREVFEQCLIIKPGSLSLEIVGGKDENN